MNERIKQLRKELGLTQQQFADRLNIKRNTLSQYEIGRNEPIDAVVSLICREFNVNEKWLRFGEGEMHAPQPVDEIAAFVESMLEYDPDAERDPSIDMMIDIFRNYMVLDPKSKKIVRNLIKSLADSIKKEED